MIAVVMLLPFMGSTQNNELSFDEIKTLLLTNNKQLKINELKINQANAMVGNSFNIDKTSVYFGYDQNNLASNNEPLNVWGVQQDFLFPTIYFSQKKLNKVNVEVESSANQLAKIKIESEFETAYYNYQYAKAKENVYQHLDSLYINFAKDAARKFELGETNYLEKLTAQSKQKQLSLDFSQAKQDVLIAYNNLKTIVQSKDDFKVKEVDLATIPLKEMNLEGNAGFSYLANKKKWVETKTSLTKKQLLPDVSLEYFKGNNPSLQTGLYGYQVGLKIPLFFGSNKASIESAKIANEIITEEEKSYRNNLTSLQSTFLAQLLKHQEALDYYNKEGNQLAKEIIKMAELSYKQGEIDIFKYLQSIETASQLKLNYLQSLNDYNQTVIKLNYLTL